MEIGVKVLIDTKNDIEVVEKMIGSISVDRLTLLLSMPDSETPAELKNRVAPLVVLKGNRMHTQKLSTLEKIGFGAGDMALNVVISSMTLIITFSTRMSTDSRRPTSRCCSCS